MVMDTYRDSVPSFITDHTKTQPGSEVSWKLNDEQQEKKSDSH